MSAQEPLQVTKDDWKLEAGILRPSHAYARRYTAWLCNQADDYVVRFHFPTHLDTASVSVHQSRLLLAGGPLSILATPGRFAEGNNRQVHLSEEDDATTFHMIKAYLYAMDVHLTTASPSALFQLVRSAHRWQLPPLYRKVCDHLRKEKMLCSPDRIMEAKDLSRLPALPSSFRVHFWDCVARFFLYFSRSGYPHPQPDDETPNRMSPVHRMKKRRREVEEDPEKKSVPYSLCPRFPDMWDLALGQNMVPIAVDAILRHHECYDEEDFILERLVDCILQYLEPQMENDSDILDLLHRVRIKPTVAPELLERAMTQELCSKRGMFLLSRVISSRSSLEHEQMISAALSPLVLLDPELTFSRSGVMHFPEVLAPATRNSDDHAYDCGSENATMEFMLTKLMKTNPLEIAIEVDCKYVQEEELPGCSMHYRLELQEGECHCKGYLKVGGKTIVSIAHKENVCTDTRLYLRIPIARISQFQSSHEPLCEMKVQFLALISYEGG